MRIGMEGFALIDRYFTKKGRHAGAKMEQRTAVKQCQYQPQQNRFHQVKPVPSECYKVVYFGEAMPTKDDQKWASAANPY